MKVTASTRKHGFGHIIGETGVEKSESPPEIEHLGNGRPHKINFHTQLFLKSCPHNTHENYCLPPETKSPPDYFVICPRPLKGMESLRPHRITTFQNHWFSGPHFMASDFGRCVNKPRPQPRRQATTPSRNTNSQHQAETSIHNIKPQTFASLPNLTTEISSLPCREKFVLLHDYVL